MLSLIRVHFNLAAFIKFGLFSLACIGSTVVEHFTHHPEVKC
jgi:hypothetical protein